ncbi:MAG: 16S rRNA (adenine(1518)-N(6)/adenine(1519)-N(6))-dimethyltransferase RsmA, partial [Balneolaceae bacterium]
MSHSPRKKKSLGQHFLRDTNMIHKIVSSIPAKKEDRVIEIGPGDGAITEYLFSTFSDFSAIEIDPVMIEHLAEKLPDLTVYKNDILKTDWSDFASDDKEIHIIGNFPYYITSQILFSLLERRSMLNTATLMMQKEVAERIVAEPRTKQYGILSVQTQLMCTPEILFDVPPAVF